MGNDLTCQFPTSCYAVGYSDECRRAEEMLVKRVPLKLEQKLTIVKLQMFQEHFNAADDEHKDAVTMTQFRRAVRRTIGDHVIDEDADMVFMKVDTYDSGIISWEVRL